jgi:hypothetical protein
MTSAFSSMLARQSLLPEVLTWCKQFHRSNFLVSTAFHDDVALSQATAGLSNNHNSKTVCEA